MAEFTPNELVRLGLERALASDAIARQKKAKRLDNAILPTFMGENGKIKRMGHGESRALIIPNLQFAKGEQMLSVPVNKGGLPAVDNRSYFAPPIPEATAILPDSGFYYQIFTRVDIVVIFENEDVFNFISPQVVFDYRLPSEILDLANYAEINNINFPYTESGDFSRFSYSLLATADPSENYNNTLFQFASGDAFEVTAIAQIQFAYLATDNTIANPNENPSVLNKGFDIELIFDGEIVASQSNYQPFLEGSVSNTLDLDPAVLGVESSDYSVYIRFKGSDSSTWFNL